jgi:deoxyuridine 5'-triphosphate nucleotidohydrolase
MAKLERQHKFKFKELSDNFTPERQTSYSAGYDVFSSVSISMFAGDCFVIPLGISLIDAPTDYYLELHPRSGFRFRSGCEFVGIIDNDYRDEIKMILYPKNDYIINKGDRIGQLIPKKMYDIMDCTTIGNDRNGGFGSTN